MRASKKRWKDLSSTQRALAAALAVVQVTLLTLAQRDLSIRPAEQVRGPKWLWRIVILVNFIGPLAYFYGGRTPDQMQSQQ